MTRSLLVTNMSSLAFRRLKSLAAMNPQQALVLLRFLMLASDLVVTDVDK